VEFEWDERKRQKGIKKHGVDVIYAALIFGGDVLTRSDDREVYGEDRFHWVSLMTNALSSSYRTKWVGSPDYSMERRPR